MIVLLVAIARLWIVGLTGLWFAYLKIRDNSNSYNPQKHIKVAALEKDNKDSGFFKSATGVITIVVATVLIAMVMLAAKVVLLAAMFFSGTFLIFLFIRNLFR